MIAPGTYAFRVHLTQKGTAEKPIVIRALDPTHPPVWDLSSTLVENAPGSYTAGDRGRGCWQISGGAYYQISGIVLANCHNSGNNSAGLRYYNGARGIQLRDCVFRGSDNGLTGGSQQSEITVEYSEFDGNGTLSASSGAPSHNIYIYGGSFTLRHSYVHDPVQAQNFHIRATTSVIEYNWFARAKSYEGDLMTDDDLSGTSQVRQHMLLRGNVLVQGASPDNGSQVIAVYNDGGVEGLSLGIRLVNNTFVGNGGHAALVHLSNEDGTVMTAELVNNIVAGTSVVTLVEAASRGVVSGSNNWIMTGASAGGLVASVEGGSPGFRNAAGKDFTLGTGSGAIGQAVTATDLPNAEYYRDEQLTRLRRVRATVNDLGAFESTTTSAPTGPYGIPLSGPVDGGADAASAVDGPPAGAGGARGTGGATPAIDGGASAGGATGGSGVGGRTGGRGTGGSSGAGGKSERGGTGGAAGVVATGGAAGTPGAGGTAGVVATGGAAGTPGAGGAAPAGGGQSSGCGCDLTRRGGGGGWWVMGFVALGGVAARLRRRRQR